MCQVTAMSPNGNSMGYQMGGWGSLPAMNGGASGISSQGTTIFGNQQATTGGAAAMNGINPGLVNALVMAIESLAAALVSLLGLPVQGIKTMQSAIGGGNGTTPKAIELPTVGEMISGVAQSVFGQTKIEDVFGTIADFAANTFFGGPKKAMSALGSLL